MTERVFFVLNRLEEFDFANLISQYLSGYTVDVGVALPPDPHSYRLIILWSYRQIVVDLPKPNNVVVFHSSDLPHGKGWAPIFYAIVEEQADYYITGILAASKVDAGDIIVKAKFRLKLEYLAQDIRKFDREISIYLVAEILHRFQGRSLVGLPQIEVGGSYRPRRNPEDNELDINKPLRELIPILRAVENHHPAFFNYHGRRFNLSIETDIPVVFPDDLQIVFP